MEFTVYEVALLKTLVEEQLAKTIDTRDKLASVPGMSASFSIFAKNAEALVELLEKLESQKAESACLQVELDELADMLMNEKLIEELSDYAHAAWSGWMDYLFSKCVEHGDGSVTIPSTSVDRWKRQAGTKYVDLPEGEKESDREEARKMITIVSCWK